MTSAGSTPADPPHALPAPMTVPTDPPPPEPGLPTGARTAAEQASPEADFDDELPTLSPEDALSPADLAAPAVAPGADLPEPSVAPAAAPRAAPPSPAQEATRAPARPAGGEETTIPMLTEIVQVPRYAREDLPASLEAVDWAELAERVRENVTERLSRRAQALLDQQLRESVERIVDRATESLATELRDAVSRMVGDIVGRAVNEELTRVHAEISRRGNP